MENSKALVVQRESNIKKFYYQIITKSDAYDSEITYWNLKNQSLEKRLIQIVATIDTKVEVDNYRLILSFNARDDFFQFYYTHEKESLKSKSHPLFQRTLL